MNKGKIYFMLFFIGFGTMAQDTLETTYPGTTQRWIKRFESGHKIDETIYYDNDQIWMKVQYVNGQEKWNWYHENGAPYFEATIKNDSLQGWYQIGYKNGQIAEKIMYQNNLENGVAFFYYPNGQLAMRGSYEQGRMLEGWQCFDLDGHPANGDWQWAFAADTSKLRMEGVVLNGAMIGEWTYTSIGNLATEKEKQFNVTFR
ncbi:MAG: hypothetical protein R8G66_03760 [Cytophagales bacterium]|nr:hypothetical protein [Cytophagales bacterium]